MIGQSETKAVIGRSETKAVIGHSEKESGNLQDSVVCVWDDIKSFGKFSILS